MINDELLDILINLVDDAAGVLLIQTGTTAERPQSQQVGNLFIDITTRNVYQFDGQLWKSILSSNGPIDLSVTKEVTKPSETIETTKPANSSSVVRATSPF